MQRWDDVETFLLSEAEEDLLIGPDIKPCLVAFTGDEPLLVAFLRSFAKGEYADPLIELLALAGPLDADRLALAVGARAWSLDDPIAPVVPQVGDLRQRVLSVHTVDGARGSVTVSNTLHPFTVSDHEVCWGLPARHDRVTGWLPDALRLAVERRAQLAVPAAEVRRQAARCVRLGHLVVFAPAAEERMDLGAEAHSGESGRRTRGVGRSLRERPPRRSRH